jgi:hypothetical protein
MGDNEWLNLDAPAADEPYGIARGCSWGGHSMVLVPELRGAFRTGEGRHAYVKPDGYGQDDFWFYDINQHRWICLHPGTDTKTFNQMVNNGEITIDANGNPVDTQGRLIPGHLLVHAWGFVTYDSHLKKIRILCDFGSWPRWYLPGESAINAGLTILENQGLNKSGKIFAPWAYNILTGTFEREIAVNAMPKMYDYPTFLYIPSQKKFFCGGRYGSSAYVRFFNPTNNTWTSENATGTGPTSYDYSGCHDPKRDQVYMAKGADNLFCYDIQTRVWTKLSFPSAYGSVNFSTNSGSITYDSLNDKMLFWNFGSTNKIVPLNPETKTFEEPIPMDNTYSSTHRETNACFYDPGLGVHFIYTAMDSYDNGKMWVYKYKKTTVNKETAGLRASSIAMTVRPNPFNSRTVFQLNRGQKTEDRGQIAGIKILDITGKIVYQLTSDLWHLASDISWNASHQPAGVYLVRLSTTAGTIQKNILKVR